MCTQSKELDKMELGLSEVQYKNLKHAKPEGNTDKAIKSAAEVIKKYKEALKVLYLISYEGDKYKGIGSKLLDVIVEKSKINNNL